MQVEVAMMYKVTSYILTVLLRVATSSYISNNKNAFLDFCTASVLIMSL